MDIAAAIAVISVVITGIGLLLSARATRRAQQLEISLTLGKDYREAWRERWSAVPRELAEADGRLEDMSPLGHLMLVDALNWLEWFGVAELDGVIHHVDFVYRTVGSCMMQTIEVAMPIIQRGIDDHGTDYWAGVLHVQSRLGDRGWSGVTSEAWRVAAAV